MGEKRLGLLANPLISQPRPKQNAAVDTLHGHPSEENGSYGPKHDEEDNDGLPKFQRHAEATDIELFYDLFFVANLTTFTRIHEINSTSTLTSYIGFFCVLWFTWCNVSLFDVRFIIDSVLERLARAVHLGVMVGLAVIGPNFNTSLAVPSAFRAMCKP